MKTKEQILTWLDRREEKDMFYRSCFKKGFSSNDLQYDDNLFRQVRPKLFLEDLIKKWDKMESEYLEWYNSDCRPMSWEEYCKQNSIRKWNLDVMPKELREAFDAYMKLRLLRDAWIKNSVGDNYYRINCFWDNRCRVSTFGGSKDPGGLSFPSSQMAMYFIKTFEDLLEIAKPLI